MGALSQHAPLLRRFPLPLMLLLLTVSFSHAFTTPQKQIISDDATVGRSLQQDFKRFTIASTLAIAPFLGGWDDVHNPTVIQPPAAHALQKKNEVLCNTGFFTNVGAWYCTDIGNIGDEGKPKALSTDAETSIDSLMGKFDLDGGDFTDTLAGKNEVQANKNKAGESDKGGAKVAKTE
mmetsp:Transcript_28646/g.60448  ORF Transcript_28646/g.60448 Transcript_28646/m.60448 type:complete len:178 (-) Transcript_28646:1734-2267(-)